MKPLSVLALFAATLALAACGSNSSSSTSSSATSGANPSSSSASATASAGSSARSASPSSHPSTSSSHAATGRAGAGPAGSVPVVMHSLAFNPATVHAKVGQTIVWVNDDGPPHNVTYVSGPRFTSSPQMNPGARFTVKLTQPGTIQYVCTIHPFMKGTIVVTK